ncbi:MAG: COX15/CtaA family protein [candidate division Zixibacteria bacterium]|nr:COX15/CtaA family protein [candidate division Zixibacteria bacterium]
METKTLAKANRVQDTTVRPGNPWVYRLALALAGATLLTILIGGSVTTMGAGDSDPSWSLRFWDWFRSWSQMPGGQIYEISHRQIGTIVGLIALAFIIVLWRSERRRWVKYLGLSVLGAVILQGLLGGLRVLTVSDPNVQQRVLGISGLADALSARLASAIVHAGLAQIVFAMTVVIAVVTSSRWSQIIQMPALPGVRKIRRLGVIAASGTLIEMILGAFVRHGSKVVTEHIVGALLVSSLCVLLALRAMAVAAEVPLLRRPAHTLGMIVQLQLFLGVASLMIDSLSTIAPTLHVVGGAGTLAATLILTARAYGIRVPDQAPAIAEAEPA